MAVEKLGPPGLHRPVDTLHAHVVRAQGSVHYHIDGQVAVVRASVLR